MTTTRGWPARPYWSEVLRTLREARGVTQDGWAAQLGVSGPTVRRWESGATAPNAEAEVALLAACAAYALFRRYDHGPLAAITVTPAWLSELLAQARITLRRTEPVPAATAEESAPPPAPVAASDPATSPSPPPVLISGNLPVALTSFVGRTEERAELAALVGDPAFRLVTLIGVGGCGKTRLAAEVARTALPAFADGVWWAELAPLTDGSLVPAAIAALLGVREDPRRPLTDSLADALGSRRLLLVLDNCEHLIEACARLAGALLTACPSLTVLATSREPLGLPGEQEWRLYPLPIPDDIAAAGADVAALLRFDSVQLLVNRATLRNPAFALTPENAPAVAEICRRLDGLPLALELAAARLPALSVEQLAARLDSRFRLLRSATPTALPRQQTLRALMDWSYDLLPTAEQTLFRRLSVFAGGFTLEAAEQVCGDPALSQTRGEQASSPAISSTPVRVEDVLDLLAHLVARSLVVMEAQEGAGRYRMLETVRQYAADRLAESAEAATLARRHAGHFLELAEQAEPSLMGPSRSQWMACLNVEQDNLRTALACFTLADDQTDARRLAGALFWFWYLRGFVAEGRRRIEETLSPAYPPPSAGAPAAGVVTDPAAAWAKALHCAGVLAWVQGDYVVARGRLHQSLASWRDLGSAAGAGYTLAYLGLVAWSCRDIPAARADTTQAVENLRGADDPWRLAFALNAAGLVEQLSANNDRARSLYEESTRLFRELDDPWGLSLPVFGLGLLARQNGDNVAAREALQTALALRRAAGDPFAVAMALSALGELEWVEHNLERAAALHTERLTLFQRVGDGVDAAYAMYDLARTLRASGSTERAVALFRENLAGATARGIPPLTAACLAGLAGCADDAGQVDMAAYLFGAATAALDAVVAPAPMADAFDWDGIVHTIRDAAARCADAGPWQAGRAASIEQWTATARDLERRSQAIRV
jgi:predicted ATPase/transcriptional regulator with XRE-family HTH domain